MEYKTTNKMTQEKIDEILRIKKERGLTAESLLEEAKKKKNPLHDLFEWDDTKAAKQWRLQQSRVIINEVKVMVDSEERDAFENLKIGIETEAPREYKHMQEIIKNTFWREQIIKSAYNQLIYWKNKYEVYRFSKFNGVIKEIGKIKPEDN